MYKYKLLYASVVASLLVTPISYADTIKFWTMEIQPERMEIQE